MKYSGSLSISHGLLFHYAGGTIIQCRIALTKVATIAIDTST